MTPRFVPSAELDQNLARWMRMAGITGVVLFIASMAGGFFNPGQFFSSYLFGYLFWLGITLGCLALLMTQFLTGGAWGVVARRSFEAASRTLPLLAVLFIPIVIGIPHLYPWAHPGDVNRDDVMRHRAWYMNPEFFIGRAILYFAIWICLMWLLNRWSREEDEGSYRLNFFERLSAPGLILYVFTVTFAAVDWAESLFAHWYSTIWGFLFVAGQGISSFGFTIAALCVLTHWQPMSEAFRASHLHDLGKLLLMTVMLWAYFSFAQLVIVWSGNLTSEIPWYFTRWHGSWGVIGLCLVFLQFLVPFLLLLSRSLKRNPAAISVVVGILLVMRLVDLYWIVLPGLDRDGIHLNWMQFTTPLGLGCLWLSAYCWHLRRRPLLPLGAPNLEEALAHGE